MPERMETAAFRRVTPAYGHLSNQEPGSSCEKQQFGIEAPAARRKAFENAPGPCPMKQFEAALRIAEVQPQQHANRKVESGAAEFPEPGLMRFDGPAIHVARAD